MKIYIAPRFEKAETLAVLGRVVEKLRALDITPIMTASDRNLFNESAVVDTDNPFAECDMVITIGGDGTILKTGKAAAIAGKPLLGINTGRLGFMATLESDELNKLERLKSGDYRLSRRALLDVGVNGKTELSLNDVVLHRGARAKLPAFTVSRNGVEVLRVRADGIIISTPTGSTAYSLSAGGAIIEPELECVEVTALSPHTLFNRPMIFAGDGVLSVSYADCGGEVFISTDGDEGAALGENEAVTISKSAYYLDIIDIYGNNFYNSIHNKLMKPLKQGE